MIMQCQKGIYPKANQQNVLKAQKPLTMQNFPFYAATPARTFAKYPLDKRLQVVNSNEVRIVKVIGAAQRNGRECKQGGSEDGRNVIEPACAYDLTFSSSSANILFHPMEKLINRDLFSSPLPPLDTY